MSAGVTVAVVAFVVMEPLAAVTHRAVMHRRPGWTWHASHHRRAARPGARRTSSATLEANDLFPVAFAIVTVVMSAIGSWSTAWHALRWVGCGVTAYGLCYLLVHDGYVHARFGALPGSGGRYVRWVTACHAEHHRTGAAPYGFLLPRRSILTTTRS